MSSSKPLFCRFIYVVMPQSRTEYKLQTPPFFKPWSARTPIKNPDGTIPKYVSEMATDNKNNVEKPKPPGGPQNKTLASTETTRQPKQQHHWERTYQCLTVYSEYDCGHELPLTVRDPRCWKCEEMQPRLCRPSDWDIGADGLCPDCETIRRQEELARQRRLARGLEE